MIRILLAEDHLLVRKGFIKILEESFPVAIFGEASNAAQALELLRNNIWDIVVLDLSMPGRSGFDLINEIKALYPNLPVLILSMYSAEQVAVRVIKAGASGYLPKDSAVDELDKAVTKVLAGKKYIQPVVADLLADEVNKSTSTGNLYDLLSDREFQVFLLIAQAKTLTEIANELSLSIKTISTYRTNILQKLNFSSNSELAAYAHQQKLIL